nr:transcription factor bhlh84 [Quercus suber]
MPIPESESVPEEKSNPPENSKKRSRSSGDSTSSYSSDDDCNASQEFNGGVSSSLSPKGNASLNSNGKTRASRGSVTDPQSLYARLLRSHDLWMYAPLAYNGMDIGLDLKIIPPRQ